MASYTEWDRLVNLFRASSKSPNIAKAFDEAKKHSIRQDAELTALAALINAPIPIPPPGGALGASLPARMPESTGSVFYVRTDGNNANTGTAYTAGGAWLTIQKALDTLTAGQICKVGPGNYSAASRFACQRDLVGPQPATLEAYDTASRPVLTRQLDVQQTASTAGRYWRFRNLIFDGTGNGDTYGIRITDHNNGIPPHHIELYGLEIRDIGDGSSIPQPQGIYFNGVNTSKTTIPNNCAVYNCWIHNILNGTDPIRSHAMYVGNVADSVFANNVFHDLTGWGFRCGSGGATSMSVRDNFFVNNTVVESSLAGGLIFYEDASGCPPQYLSGGNRVYNNIVTDTEQASYMSNFLSAVSGPADSFNLFDENIYNVSVGGGSFNASGADISSTFVSAPTNADPLFVNKATRNLRLQAGSPAINTGLADYTPAFDYEGNARVTPDLGAYRA